MHEINYNDLNQYGIKIKNHIMDNDEKRFRIISEDGSSYIRTVAPSIDIWQNSHFHSTVQEMYIVQSGWIIFVEFYKNNIIFNKYCTKEYCVSRPKVPHNIFISANSILHTVKYGDTSINDWIPFEELDLRTKNLDRFKLLEII